MSKYLDDLKEIKDMMERSTRFLSLSGWSGIAIGIVALVASLVVYVSKIEISNDLLSGNMLLSEKQDLKLLISTATITFILSIVLALYFTKQKAIKKGEAIWNSVSKQLLISMSLPLLTGGALIIVFLLQGILWPLAGFTLIFYGLALVSSAQYTYKDVYFLGLCEIALGILSLLATSYALVFWAIGFGILHIFYGFIMIRKYER